MAIQNKNSHLFKFEFENSNLNFEMKFGGRTTLTSLITSIQKLFKTMNSSLRYDSYKFALQMLNPTDTEGKCEFEWPHTPNFEVNLQTQKF
jgi:hypothetical protein